MTRETWAVLRPEHVLVSGGRMVKQDREPVPDDGPVLAAIDRLLKIAPRRVGLLGLDTAVTSHVEWITTDVIKAEITKLEAELAGHDPDGETNTHPSRQPGTPALTPTPIKIRNRGEDHQNRPPKRARHPRE